MAENTYQGSYSKRPLWQWIVIYGIIGGLIYVLAYYFFFANNSIYGSFGSDSTKQQSIWPNNSGY